MFTIKNIGISPGKHWKFHHLGRSMSQNQGFAAQLPIQPAVFDYQRQGSRRGQHDPSSYLRIKIYPWNIYAVVLYTLRGLSQDLSHNISHDVSQISRAMREPTWQQQVATPRAISLTGHWSNSWFKKQPIHQRFSFCQEEHMVCLFIKSLLWGYTQIPWDFSGEPIVKEPWKSRTQTESLPGSGRLILRKEAARAGGAGK